MKFASLLAAVAACLFICAGAARADVADLTTFTFEGACSIDCVGVGTGTLTVQNYKLGADFTNDNFVDFTYTSSIFDSSNPFEITRAELGSFGGSIGPVLPSTASVDITTDPNAPEPYKQFHSIAADPDIGSLGPWCVGSYGACAADAGPSHLWLLGTPVTTPEPATAALLVTGLVGLGLTRRGRTLQTRA